MKTFNMTVADKRLVRDETDEVIVCGNGDYQIKFTFDAEWNNAPKMFAKFTWNGEHRHEEIKSDKTVKIPMIVNASVVTVGVYAGEEGVDDVPLATTKAAIFCVDGARCGDSVPHPESGENYTNEARGYAEQAQEAAENIEQYKGLELIGKFKAPFTLQGEDYWVTDPDFTQAIHLAKVAFLTTDGYEKKSLSWSVQDSASWNENNVDFMMCNIANEAQNVADCIANNGVGDEYWIELYR